MRILHQDYETYFGPAKGWDGKNLTLSLKNQKLAMTDYVRHPEFEVHCVGVRWDDEKQPRLLRQDEIGEWYGNVDWEDTHVVAHHANFEGIINHECYAVHPGRYTCTMGLGDAIFQGLYGRSLDDLMRAVLGKQKLPDLKLFRGLHTKDITEEQWAILEAYTLNDIEGSSGLFHHLKGGISQDEHALMDLTIKMFADPKLRIDLPMAREALREAREETAELVRATGHSKEEISGNISFAELLRAELGYIPEKISPATGELTYAFAKTDKEFVALKTHKDARVRNLAKARSAVKSTLGETRAERVIRTAETSDGLFPQCYYYAKAHTMRWTGGNKMNPQNFTSGGKLRKSIVAPPGYKLGVVDSSQIECRWEAQLAGETELLNIFRTGADPYSTLASDIYGFEITKEEHPTERFMGKTARLGLGYGMGAPKFHNTIVTGARGKAVPITLDFAYKVVNIYRNGHKKIVALWRDLEDAMEWMATHDEGTKSLCDGLLTFDAETNRILFPNGCYLRYPNLEVSEEGLTYSVYDEGRWVTKYLWGGTIAENVVQAISRHTLAEHILKIAKRYRIVMLTHDEIVFLIPDGEEEEAIEFALSVLRTVPSWAPQDLPLDAEGGYDVCYSK